MFSKLTLVCFVMVLASCSYFFKEDETKKNYYNLSISEKAGMSCIDGNTQLLKDYFNLKRSNVTIEKELREMKTCLRSAIELFLKHTKGAQGDSYTTSEVHEFLDQAFEQYGYSIGFMDDVVRLKHSLIGGTPYVITKSELTSVLSYIDFVYDALADLAKERQFIFSKRKGDDRSGFLKASARLQDVIQKFSQLQRKSDGVFDYESFARLIGYFAEDAQSQKDWSNTLDLVNSLQSLLASGSRDEIKIQKFPFVLNNLGKLYLAYIEFSKFIQDEKFFTDMSTVFTFPGLISSLVKNHTVYDKTETVESLNSIHKNVFLPLRAAVATSSQQRVAVSHFEDLIETLLRIGSLSGNLRAGTLKIMIPEFFGRWLSSGNCDSNCKAKYLTLENVDVLLNVVDQWKERQLWINSIGLKQRSSIQLPEKLPTVNLQSMRDAVKAINHIHWEDYLVIGTSDFNYKDLVIFNSIYTLTTLFTRPFNDNWKKAKVNDYYLTQDQTQALYEWLRELGIDLKLVDPRTRNSGKSVFLEGNLFTSIGADPDKFNFPEIMEYLEITFTTGHKSVELMKTQFQNCQTDVVDVFDFKKLKANCFRDELHKNYSTLFFSTLPVLKDNVSQMAEPEVGILLNYLEKAARQGLIVDEAAETDTVRLISSIIQYAESLFLRFDQDKNSFIDVNELNKALDHIAPNVRLLVKQNLTPAKAKLLYSKFPDFEKDLIRYILSKKDIPSILTAEIKLGEEAGKLAFAAFKLWVDSGAPEWINWLTSHKVKVVRSDFLIVISGLSQFARINRIKAMKKVFEENVLAFDNGIKDINDPLLEKLSIEIQCSTKKSMELKQWLVDHQKEYWIKEEAESWTWGVPFLSNSKIKIKHTDLWTSELWADWSGAVTRKMIELLYKEKSLSPFCGLPFVEEVHSLLPDQGARYQPRMMEVRDWNMPTGS